MVLKRYSPDDRLRTGAVSGCYLSGGGSNDITSDCVASRDERARHMRIFIYTGTVSNTLAADGRVLSGSRYIAQDDCVL